MRFEDEHSRRKADILVFLPGQEDIEDLSEILRQKLAKTEKIPEFRIFQLFSALPSHEQLRVFDEIKTHRKVILSTNIAETSITINNIGYIIDSGFAKVRFYDSEKNIEILKLTKISKNSAIQRSGRAGREGSGRCFRLYPESDYEGMLEINEPVKA